jgi:SET domain-containing protein
LGGNKWIMLYIDTYLDKSKIHGVGVFSKENVNKGEQIKEERPEFEIEFNKDKLPSMPLALAKLIDTHAYERKIGSGILVLGIDNEKYLNHSNDPSVNDEGIALKNIKIGDEITIDYKDFDDNIKTWLT